MIDLEHDDLIEFREVPKLIKETTDGKRTISHSTAVRWRLKGVSGVRLESIFIAGVCFTSKQAVSRFLRESSVAKSKKLSERIATGMKAAKIKKAQREAEELGI